MEADLQSFVTFYLTGRKQAGRLDDMGPLKLRPAALAGYADLTRLRYDFPLVLIDTPSGERFAEPLSRLVDAALDQLASHADAERIRQHAFKLEQRIREKLVAGESGLLSEIWHKAAQELGKKDPLVSDSLTRLKELITQDGALLDCNGALPGQLIGHAWKLSQQRRAERFNEEVERLILKLSEIIEADYAISSASRSAENLRDAFGTGPLESFDFDAMSNLLKKVSVRENLPKRRRARIQKLITTLRSQRFYPTESALKTPYSFAFDTCSAAFKAYCERQSKAIELARAMAMARMEIKGEYNEERHDVLFDSFGENGLDAEARGIFPDYLVRINAAALTGTEQGVLTDILSADLPIKILVQTDDILETSPIENGHLAFTLRSKQLVRMTMGMGVYVVQSPAASLARMQQPIQRGLEHAGAAVLRLADRHQENAFKRAFPKKLRRTQRRARLPGRAFTHGYRHDTGRSVPGGIDQFSHHTLGQRTPERLVQRGKGILFTLRERVDREVLLRAEIHQRSLRRVAQQPEFTLLQPRSFHEFHSVERISARLHFRKAGEQPQELFRRFKRIAQVEAQLPPVILQHTVCLVPGKAVLRGKLGAPVFLRGGRRGFSRFIPLMFQERLRMRRGKIVRHELRRALDARIIQMRRHILRRVYLIALIHRVRKRHGKPTPGALENHSVARIGFLPELRAPGGARLHKRLCERVHAIEFFRVNVDEIPARVADAVNVDDVHARIALLQQCGKCTRAVLIVFLPVRSKEHHVPRRGNAPRREQRERAQHRRCAGSVVIRRRVKHVPINAAAIVMGQHQQRFLPVFAREAARHVAANALRPRRRLHAHAQLRALRADGLAHLRADDGNHHAARLPDRAVPALRILPGCVHNRNAFPVFLRIFERRAEIYG